MQLNGTEQQAMQIDNIDIWQIARPLRYPWRTAYGEDAAIEGILVRVTSGFHVGWGEAAPLHAPTYSPETAATCFHIARDFLAPVLLGRAIETPWDVTPLFDIFRGNPFAKAAMESACWSLFANHHGQPLHQLIGGNDRPVSAGADFGIQNSIDMLLEKVAKAVDAGFPRVKLKIRHGWDIEVVRAVRSTFPKMTFHVDCNGGYDSSHMDLMYALDKENLAMIEQPFGTRDFTDHAMLQSKIGTPVCLDESVTSLHDFEQALMLKSCRMLNIKIGRTGGIATAIKLHDMARNAGIPCWVGSMLESGVGMGALIALATLPNFTYAGDLFPTQEHCDTDITPDLAFDSSCRFHPAVIQLTPNMDRLAPCVTAQATISTKDLL